MKTLDNSTQSGLQQMELKLTQSAEASPVKTLASRESKMELKRSARDFGESSPVLLASFDRASYSWKTSQTSFLDPVSSQGHGLEGFSETWPRSGMMRNGIAYQLPPLVPLISGTAFGLLPTIGACEGKGSSKKRYKGSPHFRGAKMSEGLRTCQEDPIYTHPSFAEAAMGFPIGHTDLKD